MIRNDFYIRFQNKLEEQFNWPRIYMFKFIVPIEKWERVMQLFAKQEIETKVSKKGNYASITAQSMMYNSDKVIEKYREAEKIKGLIAL